MRRNGKLAWYVSTMLGASVTNGDRKLVFNIQGLDDDTSFVVVAVEGPRAASSIDDIFADHAHKSLGTFISEDAAREACDLYAVEWLRARKAKRTGKGASCECKEIG